MGSEMCIRDRFNKLLVEFHNETTFFLELFQVQGTPKSFLWVHLDQGPFMKTNCAFQSYYLSLSEKIYGNVIFPELTRFFDRFLKRLSFKSMCVCVSVCVSYQKKEQWLRLIFSLLEGDGIKVIEKKYLLSSSKYFKYNQYTYW